MRNRIIRYSICCILLSSLCYQSYAYGDGIEKTKKFTKSFIITTFDRIHVKVAFGDLKIVTWDKNIVKLEATLSAKANTDERAQEILDLMFIENDRTDSEVFFKTGGSFSVNKTETNNRTYNDRRNSNDPKKRKNDINQFENESINTIATLYVPENNFLIAEDAFGTLTIADRKGLTRIKSAFGSLTAGKLMQVDSVNVSFGKASVESMHSGVLLIATSHAQVNKLSGFISAIVSQSTAKISIGNELTGLNMITGSSQLYLETPQDLSATMLIAGQFSNETDMINRTGASLSKENISTPAFPGYMRYKWQSGKGDIPITISNSKGVITVGHNMVFNVNDTEKAGVKQVK